MVRQEVYGVFEGQSANSVGQNRGFLEMPWKVSLEVLFRRILDKSNH